jgi:hypothetical protein
VNPQSKGQVEAEGRRAYAEAKRQIRLQHDQRPLAERAEAEAAEITGPPCPFCESRSTSAVTEGWPGKGDCGEWFCDNCGESGTFDAHGLYWLPEGDPSA